MWMGRRPFMAAPMPKPVMASSAIGVSKQRFDPNFAKKPAVLPKISL